jgi:uncharacterized membrane protein (DUF373 family)
MTQDNKIPSSHIDTPDPTGHQHGPEMGFIRWLKKYPIQWSVRGLSVLMAGVIILGVVDVAWVLYQRLLQDPVGLLTIEDMLATFGAFMAVLIAIEIFENITIYLREDVIHVKIVMATALMAIARKIIILDVSKPENTPMMVFALAAVVIAMSVGYYLVVVKDRGAKAHDGH